MERLPHQSLKLRQRTPGTHDHTQKKCALSVALLVFSVLLLSGSVARSAAASFSYLYPRVRVGSNSRSSLVVTNVGGSPAAIQLSSYGPDGKLLQQALGGAQLLP